MLSSKELYAAVVAAGIPVDHHESDLYIPVTEETRKLVAEYQFPKNVTSFLSNIPEADGVRRMWYDIPFAYQPFWERVARIAAGVKR